MTNRALISVFDKDGIGPFARSLVNLGWEIVSSGGTAEAIYAYGIEVTTVEQLTGLHAILDHRVLTLHPVIHGGILADPTNPKHMADMFEYGIEPFDLVVVNLYPFGTNPSIDLIDIGGPTLIRGAAKNHAHVGVVTDKSQYDAIIDELKHTGELSAETRLKLASNAFKEILLYDAAIASWFESQTKTS
jgi:phosphoribosylaminoimidazolecarboxamide formyltransferase/IMP cyclohydrolase